LNQPTGKAVIGSPDPPDFTAYVLFFVKRF